METYQKDVKLSVVVPVYNAEKYLIECINSLINQTYKNLEFIFINDGSTDSTSIILDEYKKIDNRIKVYNQNNQGPSIARNVGIELATGQYITFIDADDFIDSLMYENMLNYLKTDIDCVICNMNIFQNNQVAYVKNFHDSREGVFNASDILKILIISDKENSLNNKIYNLSTIKEYSLKLDENQYYGEDLLFNLNYFSKIKYFHYIDKNYYFYRKGHSSLTTVINKDLLQDNIYHTFKIRKKYALEYGFNSDLVINKLILDTTYLLLNGLSKDNPKKYFTKVKDAWDILNSDYIKAEMKECKINEEYKFLIILFKYKIIIPFLLYAWIIDLKKNRRK